MPGECGGTPILALDVWEHVLFKLPKQRPDYINAFFEAKSGKSFWLYASNK